MNLARRILEGIHEVELQITPEFQKGPTEPVEPTGPTWGVSLSDDAKLVLVNRPWMHVVHPNADVTESNPAMVLTKHLPIEGSVQDKRWVVQGKFGGLEFKSFWSPVLEAWRFWPTEGQDEAVFNTDVVTLISRLDEIIDEEEDAPFTLIVGSSHHSKPTGGFVSIAKAKEAGAAWKKEKVAGAEADGIDPAKAEEFYYWTIVNADNERVANG